MQEILLVGRLHGPRRLIGEECYFQLDAGGDRPFPCVCVGKTAENMGKYLQEGDEISLEGKLVWKHFTNTPPTLVVFARYISYGRKARTLQQAASVG